jgi:hypothetical protein
VTAGLPSGGGPAESIPGEQRLRSVGGRADVAGTDGYGTRAVTGPGPRGRLVQRLLRWTPATAALAAVTLLAVNWFRADRSRVGRTSAEYNPAADDTLAAGRRTDFKSEVVADLVAGRVTAAEARARFLEVNRADPQALEYLRAELPGETDEDRAAYQLVLFVRTCRHPRATDVAAAVGRALLGRAMPFGRVTELDDE